MSAVADLPLASRKRMRDRTKNIILGLVAASVALVSVWVGLQHPAISVFDEAAHFDYVVKLSQGHLPRVGDRFAPETMHEIACRGETTTCDTPLGFDQVSVFGINYVAMYSPVYYSAVSVIAIPLAAASGIGLFESARIATSLLFAVGVFLAMKAALRIGARLPGAVGVGLMLSLAPLSLLQGSTITPDSMSLFWAALLVLAATSRLRWRRRLVVVVVIATLAALNKANFIPLACAGIWLAAIAPADPADDTGPSLPRTWRPYVWGAVLSVIPLATQYAWNAWRVSRGVPGIPPDGNLNQVLRIDGPITDAIAQAMRVLLQPIQDSGYPQSGILWGLGVLTQTLVFGAAFFVALNSTLSGRPVSRSIAIAGTAGVLLSLVFLPTTFYVLYHSIGTQARYGLPLLVFLGIGMVGALRRSPVANWLLLGFGSTVAALVVYELARGGSGG